MSLRNEDRAVPDELLIERLIDGELDEASRAAFLMRLETAPGGWRRCALAFLEAQAWREALHSPEAADIAFEQDPAVRFSTNGVSLPEVGPKVRRRHHRPAFKAARIAAAVVAAFGAGWIARELSRPAPAMIARPSVSGRVRRPDLHPPSLPAPQEGEALALTPSPQPVSTSETTDLAPAPPLGTVGPLPASLVRQLQRRGYLVEQRERTLSMDFDDGRHLSVPVGEVKVQYVGDRTY
jgi:hypothetical protein